MSASETVLRTADGVPLPVKLRRSARRNRLTAICFVIPLFAFTLFTFIIPIGTLLFRSIHNPTVVDALPETVEALRRWDATVLPDEATFATLARELVAARKAEIVGKVATQLNFEQGGLRTMVTETARKLEKVTSGPYEPAMLAINPDWGQLSTWGAIRNAGKRYTPSFYLAATDHTFNTHGGIVATDPEDRIYVTLFVRTLWVSLLITGICLVLGYPIAYLMANVPTRISNLLMIMVLLPFWTSLLVRTTAWIVILQREGVLNQFLIWLGLVDENNTFILIYNMAGTLIAMTQILLPFMILPLYSVMKTIPPSYVRAAESLGATPERAFFTVYFPNSVPGIGAGSLLVFILAIGYYITPSLVGGRTGQLISNFIAYHMQTSLNWGLAGALSGILLLGVLGLFIIYNRVVGIDNLKLG
jgi:putative spermidine/putrescine transport system permease protein